MTSALQAHLGQAGQERQGHLERLPWLLRSQCPANTDAWPPSCPEGREQGPERLHDTLRTPSVQEQVQ